MKATRLSDKKLVWVDEAVFTFNTFRKRAWSGRNDSIRVQDTEARVQTMAFIAAISEDRGLEAWSMHPNAISTPEFVAFVEQLSTLFHGAEFTIFMDNLQVHKTQAVADTCKELKVQRIFNVPYSPDFNGIEAYFSLVSRVQEANAAEPAQGPEGGQPGSDPSECWPGREGEGPAMCGLWPEEHHEEGSGAQPGMKEAQNIGNIFRYLKFRF